MQTIVLGSGSPLPDPERAGPSTLVRTDHVTDLNDVVTSRWATSFQPNPLPVFGPPGTASLLRATEAMLEPDIGYRMAHHADLQWRPSADVDDCERGDVLAEHSVRVTAAPTDHAPVRPTVGHRVDEGGSSVVIAGDTVPCAGRRALRWRGRGGAGLVALDLGAAG